MTPDPGAIRGRLGIYGGLTAMTPWLKEQILADLNITFRVVCGQNAWYIDAQILIEESEWFKTEIQERGRWRFRFPPGEHPSIFEFIMRYFQHKIIRFPPSFLDRSLKISFHILKAAADLKAHNVNSIIQAYIKSEFVRMYNTSDISSRRDLITNAYNATTTWDREIRDLVVGIVIEDVVDDVNQSLACEDPARAYHFSRICYFHILDLLSMIWLDGYQPTAEKFLDVAASGCKYFIEERRPVIHRTQASQPLDEIVWDEICRRCEEYLMPRDGEDVPLEMGQLLLICEAQSENLEPES